MGRNLNCWFPHDANSRNDWKISKLRRILGAEGVGIFWMLIEILREQPEFKYPLSQTDELEFDLRIPKEKIISVIRNFDLFVIDESQNFFSVSLTARLQPYLEKSQRARDAVNLRWSNAKKSLDTNVDTKVSSNADTIRKEDIIKQYNNWFDEFWKEYPKKTDKKESKEIFLKICKTKVKFDEIFSGLKELKLSESWTKENGKFVPSPARFLRKEKWNDETSSDIVTRPVLNTNCENSELSFTQKLIMESRHEGKK